MKKAIVLIALLLLFMVSAQAAELSHVTDEANVLTAGQEASLQQMAEEVFNQTGFDIILHTTNDSQRKSPFDYSMDYYHSFRDAEQYPDGALFAIMFDTWDYYEATRGRGIPLLTHRQNHDLAKIVQRKLSDGNYYGAMVDYVRYVQNILLSPESLNVQYVPPTPMSKTLELAPYIGGGGLLIGLIYAFVLKSQMKTPKYRQDAQSYILRNSLNLTDSREIFLYQNVVRTKIESSSSSGRSGGGFSSGSRGGTSYGGRGGKF